ncbi:MAG: DEAD/DEAH box helicase [Caldisphaera sp.]
MEQDNSKNPLNLLEYINSEVNKYGSKLSHIYTEKQEFPELGPNINDIEFLSDAIRKSLIEYGIIKLYKFQYDSIKSILNGKDTIIVAGTGTGKTEGFLIPVLEKATNDKRSLLLYPTKSLARDQIFRIKQLSENLGISFGILDGDTPLSERKKIYENPPLLLVSNPDMVHYDLSLNKKSKSIFKDLDYIILDEMHVYKGVFGSHVKWVLYRLSQLSKNTLFVGAGATIGNPEEIGEKLFDRKINVIYGPKRRKGLAYHIFLDYGNLSRWTFTSYIISLLVKKGLKVLSFTDSQQMSELIARIAKRNYEIEISLHRAGLKPEERKEIEEKFRRNLINAIVATPTLELGIDIGDLDAIVMSSLPRSYTSYLQRAGRAGRREKPGLIITVMGDDPIEAFYLNNPNSFFSQEPDPSYIQPENKEVSKLHLLSYLLQKGYIKREMLPKEFINVVDDLKENNLISEEDNVVYINWKKARDYVNFHGSLRSVGPIVKIYNKNKEIGFRELPNALYELYPGAIYFHGGKTFLSTDLDINSLRADLIELKDLNYYTKPLYNIDLIDMISKEERVSGIVKLKYGDVHLLITVEGYVIKEEFSSALISETPLETPIKWDYWTKGILAKYPDIGFESGEKRISSYHALEHVLISASRPIVGSSDTDLGGISYPSGHIVIYDSTMGGNGASRLVYERFEKVEKMAHKIVSGCTCNDGCPRCVFSPYCGNNNQFLSRKGALSLLDYILNNYNKEESKDDKLKGRPIA